MALINSLPRVREPIAEYNGFRFVPWAEIFPAFKGATDPREASFFGNLIRESGARDIIDFGVGAGDDLSTLLLDLSANSYNIQCAAGIDIDGQLLNRASDLFSRTGQSVSLHHADWSNLVMAEPPVEQLFDFALLTGNSLTHFSTGSRATTRQALRRIAKGLRSLLKPGASLFIDTRNFDFVRTLAGCTDAEVINRFRFERSIYYHGVNEHTHVFPAYISDTLVVLHYYDLLQQIWSANDFFPIYERDMHYMLRRHFDIAQVYQDFAPARQSKSLFTQFLAKAR